jgi:uncharacterized Zn-finger protein
MAELENDEINRQLCSVDIFSWSPETQEQILAEWDDWQEPTAKKPTFSCDECGKTFTRSDNLKRHVQSYHSGEKCFPCDKCDKTFATKDKLNRRKKVHCKEKVYECSKCHKKFDRNVCRDLY